MMIRRAGMRKASSSDFMWEADDGGVMTEYPYRIPGYPGDLNIYISPDGNAPDDVCPWNVDAHYYPPESAVDFEGIVVDCWHIFGFIPEDDSLESVEQAVEDLDPYYFSNALDDMGVEPVVDENGDYATASRHARHATRWTASED